MSGMNLGTATGYLDLDLSKFSKGIDEAKAKASAASKDLGSAMNTVGGTVKDLGKNMTALVTGPIVAFEGAAVKTAASFESNLSKVTAVSGQASDAVITLANGSMTTLKEKAMEMGAKTKFSASEAADAMYYMGLAGWDSKQMVEGLDGVMNLAAASGEDLATTSDIVTDALTAFGMKASDASRFADILATTSSKSNTNVSLLGESFKYVAPLCGALGYSAEDCATALGMMANSGIKGSQAGTSLKTALANLAKPTDAQAKMMDQLGISIVNSDGSMKSMADVMTMLRQRFSTLSADQRVAAAATLFGKEAMAGMLSIVNDSVISMDELSEHLNESGVDLSKYGWTIDDVAASYNAYGDAAEMASDLVTELGMSQQDADKVMQAVNASLKDGGSEWDKLNGSIKNCTGSAEDMANEMNNNLVGQLTILKSTVETILIQFGDLLMPLIKNVVAKLQEFATAISNLSDGQKEMILKVITLVATIGPLLLIVGKAITLGVSLHNKITILKGAFETIKLSITHVGEAFSLARAGFTGFASQTSVLGTVLGSLNAPILAIVAAIAVLVAAFVHLWQTNEDFRNKMMEIWNGIVSKFQEFTQGIVDRLNKLGFDFKSITDVIKAIWDTFCNFLAPVFEGVFAQIGNILQEAFDVITGILDVFIGIFTGDWSQVWTGVKEIFGGVWDFIVNTFSTVLDTLKGIADAFLGLFGTSWNEVWTGISEFFMNIWNGIASFFTNLWDGIVNVVTTVWETIKNVISVGIMFIQELFSAAFQLITVPFRFIWENCKNIIVTVWNTISGFISSVLGTIKNIIVTVWTAISGFISGVLGTIKNIFSTVWNAIKGVVQTISGIIKSIITTVWGVISSVTSTIWNGIKSVISNVWNGIMSVITSVMNVIKSVISSAWGTIKTYIVNPLQDAFGVVKSIFDGIKNKISAVMDGAKSIISGAMQKIKGFFNIKLEFPKIKLPHFKLTGKLSLSPPSVPHFSVDWYKKAMGGGMILNSPTLFGYDSSTGKFLGGGEAGSETVVGTSSLMGMIRSSVSDVFSQFVSVLRNNQNNVEAVGDIVIPVYIGNDMLDTLVVTANERHNFKSGGR